MRNIKNITINKAIIHVLDNALEEPLLNQRELYLTDDTLDFIGKHIAKASSDEEARFAIFDGNSKIKDLFIKARGSEFLENTKDIAKEFFDISRSVGLIGSGDLIIVKFECEFGKMIAILKMTYNKTFVHDINYEDEKMVVDIKPKYIALPGTVQRLQKCALINEDGTLLVVNRPTKSEKEAKNTELFPYEFLRCSWIDDKRDLTKNFAKASERWIRENFQDDAGEAEYLRREVTETLRNDDAVNIKDIANYIKDETLADDFVEAVREELKVDKIEVDKDWVDKKLKRKRLKVDKDIDIYINIDAYNDINRFQVKRNGDGTVDLIVRQVRNYFEK